MCVQLCGLTEAVDLLHSTAPPQSPPHTLPTTPTQPDLRYRLSHIRVRRVKGPRCTQGPPPDPTPDPQLV